MSGDKPPTPHKRRLSDDGPDRIPYPKAVPIELHKWAMDHAASRNRRPRIGSPEREPDPPFAKESRKSRKANAPNPAQQSGGTTSTQTESSSAKHDLPPAPPLPPSPKSELPAARKPSRRWPGAPPSDPRPGPIVPLAHFRAAPATGARFPQPESHTSWRPYIPGPNIPYTPKPASERSPVPAERMKHAKGMVRSKKKEPQPKPTPYKYKLGKTYKAWMAPPNYSVATFEAFARDAQRFASPFTFGNASQMPRVREVERPEGWVSPAQLCNEEILENIFFHLHQLVLKAPLPCVPIKGRDPWVGTLNNDRLTNGEIVAYKTAIMRKSLYDYGMVCKSWWCGSQKGWNEVVIVGERDAERALKCITHWIPVESTRHLCLTLQMSIPSVHRLLRSFAHAVNRHLEKAKPVVILGLDTGKPEEPAPKPTDVPIPIRKLTILHAFEPEALDNLHIRQVRDVLEMFAPFELDFEFFGGERVIEKKSLDTVARALRWPWGYFGAREQFKVVISQDDEMGLMNDAEGMKAKAYVEQKIEGKKKDEGLEKLAKMNRKLGATRKEPIGEMSVQVVDTTDETKKAAVEAEEKREQEKKLAQEREFYEKQREMEKERETEKQRQMEEDDEDFAGKATKKVKTVRFEEEAKVKLFRREEEEKEEGEVDEDGDEVMDMLEAHVPSVPPYPVRKSFLTKEYKAKLAASAAAPLTSPESPSKRKRGAVSPAVTPPHPAVAAGPSHGFTSIALPAAATDPQPIEVDEAEGDESEEDDTLELGPNEDSMDALDDPWLIEANKFDPINNADDRITGYLYVLERKYLHLSDPALDNVKPDERARREMWKGLFGDNDNIQREWSAADKKWLQLADKEKMPRGWLPPLGWNINNHVGVDVLRTMLDAWIGCLNTLVIRGHWMNIYQEIKGAAKRGALAEFHYHFIPLPAKTISRSTHRRRPHRSPNAPLGALKSLDNILMWDFRQRPEKWFRKLEKKKALDAGLEWEEPPPTRKLVWYTHVPFDMWMQQKDRRQFKGNGRGEAWRARREDDVFESIKKFMLEEGDRWEEPQCAADEGWSNQRYFDEMMNFVINRTTRKTQVSYPFYPTDKPHLWSITRGQALTTDWLEHHVARHRASMAVDKQLWLEREERWWNEPEPEVARRKWNADRLGRYLVEIGEEGRKEMMIKLRKKHGAKKLWERCNWDLGHRNYPGVTIQVEMKAG